MKEKCRKPFYLLQYFLKLKMVSRALQLLLLLRGPGRAETLVIFAGKRTNEEQEEKEKEKEIGIRRRRSFFSYFLLLEEETSLV